MTYSTSDSFDRTGVATRLQHPSANAHFSVFADEVPYPAARTLFSIDAEDLNGDGHEDVVVAVTDGEEGVSIGVQLADGEGNFPPPTYYRTGLTTGPWSAVIAQLGPDGLPDVVLAHALNGVYVHYGLGDGRFRQGVKIGE